VESGKSKVKSDGYSLLEVMMALTIMVIVGGAAIPLAHGTVDRSRAAGAANYVAGRLTLARFEAVRRSARVAIRFVERSDGYWMQTHVDRNRNGVLAADITQGIDVPITADERLDYHFSGVEFGIHPGVTGIDAGPFDATDPIQIGNTTLVSFSPTGSATSGTVFIRGLRGNQFAVRVLGATGRTRVLEFNFGKGIWLAR
jgi:prepilin-type N-terminal cleavage/methylation domain-containing protein